ncbi:MAG: hypothetical protein IJ935_07385 [Afipia sp.]|nr:hypothetical protein [Afipia sp.]
MDFADWMKALATELGKTFSMDGAEYIRQTGEECWHAMFEDGMSPEDAAGEEAYAASTMLG